MIPAPLEDMGTLCRHPTEASHLFFVEAVIHHGLSQDVILEPACPYDLKAVKLWSVEFDIQQRGSVQDIHPPNGKTVLTNFQ